MCFKHVLDGKLCAGPWDGGLASIGRGGLCNQVEMGSNDGRDTLQHGDLGHCPLCDLHMEPENQIKICPALGTWGRLGHRHQHLFCVHLTYFSCLVSLLPLGGNLDAMAGRLCP